MFLLFLIYGLGLSFLFASSHFELAGFQLDFYPLGQSIMLVGFSITASTVFVWLPLRHVVNLGLERKLSRHWRQLPMIGSTASSAMKRPPVILSLSVMSLLLVVLPLLMHRTIGGVWENGVLRGYALYLTQNGRIAVSLNVLLMVILAIQLWPRRNKGMLSIHTVLLVFCLISAALSLHLATDQYVFMSLNPIQNELLSVLLVTFLTTSLLALNLKYASISIVKKGFAIENILPPSLIEALGILTIALAVLATIIQHFNGFISQLLGQGAFYTFLFVVLLHVVTPAPASHS